MKKIALGLCIAIILPLMLYYGVSTFSPPPNYSDYAIMNFYEDYENASDQERKVLKLKQEILEAKFKSVNKTFQQRLFFTTVPAGFLLIVIGVFLLSGVVGSGLIFGGILNILSGYLYYWSELSNSVIFLSLIIAFIILITVGYKKLEGKIKPKNAR